MQEQERRAIVRIDDKPVGTKFQGVWLELVDGTRWLIDSWPREIWTWFRDREVIVIGECFEPGPDAIAATHFRVDTMRDARPERGVRPYLAIGPEVVVSGEVVADPAGTRTLFRIEDGTTYGVIGEAPPLGTPVRVRCRALNPDMSYAARGGGRDLWIAGIES